MANRWLFAGGGLDQVRSINGPPVASTVSAFMDTAYVDHSVYVTSTGTEYAFDFVDGDEAVTGEKLFVRWSSKWNNSYANFGDGIYAIIENSAGPWLALKAFAANELALYYNSGTGSSPVWTRLGTNAYSADAGRQTWVVWVTLGSPHTVGWSVYSTGNGLGNTIEDGMTFTQPAFTSASFISFHCPNGTLYAPTSEVAATVGINLVGSRVRYCKPNAAGASSGFSGAYTAIDDVGVDDADSIASTTAGQRSTFSYTDMPALGTNDAVGDVFLVTRAKNDGVAPLNLKPVWRTATGVDNVGAAFTGMTLGYKSFTTRFTGLSKAEIDGSQFGVESAA